MSKIKFIDIYNLTNKKDYEEAIELIEKIVETGICKELLADGCMDDAGRTQVNAKGFCPEHLPEHCPEHVRPARNIGTSENHKCSGQCSGSKPHLLKASLLAAVAKA